MRLADYKYLPLLCTQDRVAGGSRHLGPVQEARVDLRGVLCRGRTPLSGRGQRGLRGQ